jgi:hypothetical protein
MGSDGNTAGKKTAEVFCSRCEALREGGKDERWERGRRMRR